jgi:hypothetical protein
MEGAAATVDPYFDPASLGGDGAEPIAAAEQAWDPNAAAYDPNTAAYDPNAAQGWDPNTQAYDPNAPQAWDPNAQPYDPNAAQAWDPNAQPYDPNAPQAWDPNAQPYDPNAPQAWDPNAQPYDPNAPQAWDPNTQAYDPNAAQGLDPTAEDAAGFDATLAPVELGTTPAEGWQALASWEPGATAGEAGLGPDALAGALDAADPSAEPGPALDASALPPLTLGEYDDPNTVPLAPEAAEADAGLFSDLPFDPAVEATVHAGDLAEPSGVPALGEYDDLSAFDAAAPAAGDLPADGPGFHAAATVGREAAGWQPDAALEAGFELESAGSFEGTGTADGGAAELGDVTELSEAELSEEADPEAAGAAPAEDPYAAAPADGAFEPFDAGAAALDPEAVAEQAEALAFDVDAAAEPQASEPAASEPEVEHAAFAPEQPAPQPEPEPAAPPHEEIQGAPTIDGEEILEELPPEEAAPPPALDFEPLPSPQPAAPAAQAATAPVPSAPSPAASAAASAPAAAVRSAPAPAPAPPPEPGAQLEGVHRVVVHTLDGQVKRGVLDAPDLAAAVLGLAPQPGASPEVIGTDKVKAIFFMLSPGEKAPAPEGQRVRVTFRDGRQVAGFSPDYREGSIGFFMVPADTRTNTGRIWVYRSAVRQVSVT